VLYLWNLILLFRLLSSKTSPPHPPFTADSRSPEPLFPFRIIVRQKPTCRIEIEHFVFLSLWRSRIFLDYLRLAGFRYFPLSINTACPSSFSSVFCRLHRSFLDISFSSFFFFSRIPRASLLLHFSLDLLHRTLSSTKDSFFRFFLPDCLDLARLSLSEGPLTSASPSPFPLPSASAARSTVSIRDLLNHSAQSSSTAKCKILGNFFSFRNCSLDQSRAKRSYFFINPPPSILQEPTPSPGFLFP